MIRSASMFAGSVVLAGMLGGCGGDPGFDSEAETLGQGDEAFTFGPIGVPLPTVTAVPVPPVVDLVPRRFILTNFNSGLPRRYDIEVKNIGTGVAFAQNGSVSINGTVITGAKLHQSVGPAVPEFTIGAGQIGTIEISTSMNIQPCTSFNVVIDAGHSMQGGSSNVFANDTAIMGTLCALGWQNTITARNLGHDPDPSVADKSLSDIVSSFVSGRPDGQLCSSCHFGGAANLYSPDVFPHNGTGPHIDPLAFLDDRRWGDGMDTAVTWSFRFINNPNFRHTDALREAVGRWRTTGQLR